MTDALRKAVREADACDEHQGEQSGRYDWAGGGGRIRGALDPACAAAYCDACCDAVLAAIDAAIEKHGPPRVYVERLAKWMNEYHKGGDVAFEWGEMSEGMRDLLLLRAWEVLADRKAP